jgi:hypothetical protein
MNYSELARTLLSSAQKKTEAYVRRLLAQRIRRAYYEIVICMWKHLAITDLKVKIVRVLIDSESANKELKNSTAD